MIKYRFFFLFIIISTLNCRNFDEENIKKIDALILINNSKEELYYNTVDSVGKINKSAKKTMKF